MCLVLQSPRPGTVMPGRAGSLSPLGAVQGTRSDGWYLPPQYD